MELQYKGCDININLLGVKDGFIYYEFAIMTHKSNKSEDYQFEDKVKYTNDEEAIRHIYTQAQEWIDNHL